MWRTPSELCLLACRRRLQPYSASGAVWASALTISCLLSCLSDRFCKEKLRMSRFAKRGNTIQLRLGSQTLPVSRSPDGRHPEDGLYSEQGSFLYLRESFSHCGPS